MNQIVEKIKTNSLFFVFAFAAAIALPMMSIASACPSGDEDDEGFVLEAQSLCDCEGECDDDCDEDKKDEEEFAPVAQFVDSSDCGGDKDDDEE